MLYHLHITASAICCLEPPLLMLVIELMWGLVVGHACDDVVVSDLPGLRSLAVMMMELVVVLGGDLAEVDHVGAHLVVHFFESCHGILLHVGLDLR